MYHRLAVFALTVCCVFLSASLSLSQDEITDKNILSSFAKIVRENQYICRSCSRVQPLGGKQKELSYEVVCHYDLVYEVVLTPSDNLIVRPVNEL